MKSQLPVIGLVLILGLATITRFWRLAQVPAALNRDEAALAYNAFLIHQTGADEWGQRWPLTLKSFGDYKLSGYVWLLVALFRMFGDSDSVIRWPAAAAGVAVVGLSFAIVRQAAWPKRSQWWVLGVVAVSPVMLFYSRMAWEAMVALAWWLLSIWVVSKPKTQHRWRTDILGLVAMSAAILTYNTPLLLAPWVVVGVVLGRGWKQWRAWVLPVMGLCLVAGLGFLVQRAASAQKSAVTLFGDPTVWAQFVEYRSALPSSQQLLLGNKYVYLTTRLTRNWVASWSPAFVVQRGGAHPWHQVPGTGHLVSVVYVMAVVGWLGWLIDFAGQRRQKLKSEAGRWQLWWWLTTMVSLGPAVITVDAPHATRSLVFLLTLIWWSGFGVWFLTEWLRRWSRRLAQVAVVALVSLAVYQSGHYLWRYFRGYPAQSTRILKAGLTEAVQDVEQRYPGVPVAVVDEDGYSYIQVAWSLRLPPSVFRATVIMQQPNQVGLQYGQQVGRYHFIAQQADRVPTEVILLQWDGTTWNRYDFSRSSSSQ